MFRLTVAVFLAFAIALSYGACPTIISRSEWNARSPTSISYLSGPVPYVFIHHATGSNCNSRSSCANLVRAYQNYHMDTHGWSDIGFSFVVGGDGSVFEARGWERVGAHIAGYNSISLGLCLTGEFNTELPPAVQQQAVKDLIACGVSLEKIQSNYILRGHRDMGASACPGDKLYAEIKTWPHY